LRLTIEFEQEDDGRWIAEVPELPAVHVQADSRDQAGQLARALALRTIADQIEAGDPAGNNLDTMSFAS
jgi:predicted RNase H-like HicB family nuclease